MLNVPLNVRLITKTGDAHVTRRLKDLTLRSVAPGGFASAELPFDHPLTVDDPAVAMYGKVIVYDGRNGETVWEGRQEDPGRGATSDSPVWSLNAFGPAALAEDNPITACYVENGNENWQQAQFGRRDVQVGSDDDDPPALQVQFNDGTVIGTGDQGLAICRLIRDCGGHIARVKVTWDAGATASTWQVQIRTASGIGVGTQRASANWDTAGGALAARVTADFAVGDDVALFGINRSGAAATVSGGSAWVTAQPLVIQQTRYDVSGAEITTAATYTSDAVLASDVVADLLGRVLTEFDGTNAVIDPTSFPIDRLVYPDPTSPAQILEDLMAIESGHYWAAWETTAGGRYRFEWKPWPTTVRYEMSITGDFDSPGSVGDLYNRVLVRYRDRNGRSRSVTRTLAQADLDNAALTRTGTLDLGDNIGSVAIAQQAGDAFLLDHNSPPNAGSVVINQPILDLEKGRLVEPWEIRPGSLIRVRGVRPRVDALNATDRDGVTIFRLISTDYRASTNSCTAELDSYSRSMANQVLAAHQRIDRLRKR